MGSTIGRSGSRQANFEAGGLGDSGRLCSDLGTRGQFGQTCRQENSGLCSPLAFPGATPCRHRIRQYLFPIMKQHVFKRSRTVDGLRVRAKTYSGRYRLDGDSKDTTVALGVTDKQVAQSRLTEIVRQAEREREGLASPARQIETVQAPLNAVVEEWHSYLVAKGRKPHHCGVSKLTMGVLIRECGWKRVGDVTPDSLMSWLCVPRGRAAKTLNEYIGCVRSMMNWLVRSGRLPSNPLASVEKVETRGRQVRNRHAFTHEEFLKLIAVAGPADRVLYATAYYTGIRRGELRTMCWGDLNLSADSPSVTVLAEYAKSKTRADLPLYGEIREMLVAHFNSCDSPRPSDRVFVVTRTLERFYRHLKLAGIPKVDERGKTLDFHSLRHGLATRLASLNVPLQIAMKLMRHSDPKLTAKVYVDQASLPLMSAISLLPGMSNGKSLSPHSSLDLGATGDFGSHAVATIAPDFFTQCTLNEELSRHLTPFVATCQMEPLVGFEPTTCSLRMSCSTPELQRRKLLKFNHLREEFTPAFQFASHFKVTKSIGKLRSEGDRRKTPAPGTVKDSR